MSAPRTILYTGKGGVGKTSVAAATALRCASAGQKTLVLSTDPAHSLSDVLGGDPIGPDPAEVAPGLWAQEVRAQEEIERHWSAVQGWAGDALVEHGMDRITAEELTVPPGGDELFALLQIKRAHEEDDFDVIVVDCAPTGETLRLLSFPDVARWWLEKVFPRERQILAAARPFARSVIGIDLPGEAVWADVQNLIRNLVEMEALLRDRSRVSLRLVMNPDRMVIGEAMRTFTYLNLYGYLCDAVVVNRVFPDGVGAYFDGWRERQREHLELVESAFAPVPVLRAPYFEHEVVGPEMLGRLAEELFGDAEAAGVLHAEPAHELTVEDGSARLRVAIPFAEKGDITLRKVGPELVVRVDGHKRTIVLPARLAAYKPTAATFDEGALEVTLDAAG